MNSGVRTGLPTGKVEADGVRVLPNVLQTLRCCGTTNR
jgi:hypothetical protein